MGEFLTKKVPLRHDNCCSSFVYPLCCMDGNICDYRRMFASGMLHGAVRRLANCRRTTTLAAVLKCLLPKKKICIWHNSRFVWKKVHLHFSFRFPSAYKEVFWLSVWGWTSAANIFMLCLFCFFFCGWKVEFSTKFKVNFPFPFDSFIFQRFSSNFLGNFIFKLHPYIPIFLWARKQCWGWLQTHRTDVMRLLLLLVMPPTPRLNTTALLLIFTHFLINSYF